MDRKVISIEYESQVDIKPLNYHTSNSKVTGK